MKLTSIIAIYGLIWVLSAFLVLPFGVRTHDDEGLEKTPGQADSAPVQFRAGRVLLRATVVALILFSVFYANYVYGWIDAPDLDFFGGPERFQDIGY